MYACFYKSENFCAYAKSIFCKTTRRRKRKRTWFQIVKGFSHWTQMFCVMMLLNRNNRTRWSYSQQRVIIRGAKKRGFFFFVLSNFFPIAPQRNGPSQSDLSLDHVPGEAAVAQKGRSGHNQKLLQALDDGLRWVLSKNIINHIHFQMWLDAIVLLFIFQDVFL